MNAEQISILADTETGITSNLCDSETGDVIRAATETEARESVAASDEGHIVVDWRSEGGWMGEDFRRCYVSL
jgi:hypothetical protein